jgi:hypothetical protein
MGANSQEKIFLLQRRLILALKRVIFMSNLKIMKNTFFANFSSFQIRVYDQGLKSCFASWEQRQHFGSLPAYI